MTTEEIILILLLVIVPTLTSILSFIPKIKTTDYWKEFFSGIAVTLYLVTLPIILVTSRKKRRTVEI